MGNALESTVAEGSVGGGQVRQQPIPRANSTELDEISLEYPYVDLANATGGFSASNKLGQGGAGAVYRGVLGGGTEVAIKEMLDLGGLEGFEDEVRVLSRFRHPNLVTLFGYGSHGNKKYLLYQLAQGGDLRGRLMKCLRGEAAFSWQQRLHVAAGAANGLSHMVNSHPKAFHRDIKPDNILVGPDGSAKMADFGLAGIIYDEGVKHLNVATIGGTPGYLCWEYLETGRVTEYTDVYAFGVVLLELLVNRPPAICGKEGLGEIFYPLMQTVQPLVPGAKLRLLEALDARAAWPRPLASELADLALACVDWKPERRPAFHEIVLCLRRLSKFGNL